MSRFPKGGSILTHKKKEWAYEKWCLGYTQMQIARKIRELGGAL